MHRIIAIVLTLGIVLIWLVVVVAAEEIQEAYDYTGQFGLF